VTVLANTAICSAVKPACASAIMSLISIIC
jgi:hypothetical protein